MAGTLIFYGDSNTFGYDPTEPLTARYPADVIWTGILQEKTDCKVINRGECGREIPHSEAQISFVLRQMENWRREMRPVQLWVMLGTNDLLKMPHAAAEDVAERMTCFLKQLLQSPSALEGEITLKLMGPPLLRRGSWVTDERLLAESRRLEAAYRAAAEELGISWISTAGWGLPLCSDGVHLTAEGHRLFAEHMLEVLEEQQIPPGTES